MIVDERSFAMSSSDTRLHTAFASDLAFEVGIWPGVIEFQHSLDYMRGSKRFLRYKIDQDNEGDVTSVWYKQENGDERLQVFND